LESDAYAVQRLLRQFNPNINILTLHADPYGKKYRSTKMYLYAAYAAKLPEPNSPPDDWDPTGLVQDPEFFFPTRPKNSPTSPLKAEMKEILERVVRTCKSLLII
jgi:hypothetical protein